MEAEDYNKIKKILTKQFNFKVVGM